ncbi:predicted protein [Uncinocarpus reesii 1704]|uniref:Uncharacterized protein n=1 Tax=Uncinocarpus reesii (strain UAMH 1704) TaxID=336963 RepID=C4JXD4_UNCRE|nr:uncharacterized protein UREG_06307 [Uncinocarpus reesii 1704]EEP81442.1 predicted protein [Uncinocarpus reesii 1704]
MSLRSSKTSSFKHFTTAGSSLLSCSENGVDTEMINIDLTAEIHIVNDNVSGNNNFSGVGSEPTLQLSIFIKKSVVIAERLLKRFIIFIKKFIMSSVVQIKEFTVSSTDIKKSVANSVV